MTEMHLKKSGFTYSASVPFTKSKERIKKLKKQETQDILIKKEKTLCPLFMDRVQLPQG